MQVLYKAAFASAFASPRRPDAFRSACRRIGSLLVLAIATSWLLSRAVKHLPLTTSVPDLPLAATALFIIQLSVLATLWASAGITSSNRDTFARWLVTMPLSQWQCWLVLSLPRLTLAGLAVTLLSWPLGVAFSALGLHPLLLGAACMGGTISALGMAHGLPQRLAVSQLLLLSVLLGSEHRAIKQLYAAPNTGYGAACLVFVSIVFASSLLFINSYRYVYTNITRLRPFTMPRLTRLPPATWFIKKLLRAASFRLSFLAALGMNIIVAFGARKYQLEAGLITLFLSLTIASNMADIRALTQRRAPAEITALRGTAYFIRMQFLAACLAAIALAIPLWLVPTFAVSFTAICLLLTGLAAGIFAGSVLVPQPRDISGQFLAVLLCVGIVAGLPALPVLPADIVTHPYFQLSCAALLMLASVYTECRRNYFRWRNQRYV